MGGVIVCDCFSGCGVDFYSLSCDKSPFSLGDETPGRGFMAVEFPLEDLFSGRLRGVQRQPLHALAVFQVPSAQRNPMPKRKILVWRNLPAFSMNKRVHGVTCYKDFLISVLEISN